MFECMFSSPKPILQTSKSVHQLAFYLIWLNHDDHDETNLSNTLLVHESSLLQAIRSN